MLTRIRKNRYIASRSTSCATGFASPMYKADTTANQGGFFCVRSTTWLFMGMSRGRSYDLPVPCTRSCNPFGMPALLQEGRCKQRLYKELHMSQQSEPPKILLKNALLRDRIVHDFGGVRAFERTTGLKIRKFLSGRRPDISMTDVYLAGAVLGLTENEISAFFSPEIYFGELRRAEKEEIARRAKAVLPAWEFEKLEELYNGTDLALKNVDE